MTNPALLNNVQHGDLKVIARRGAGLGENVNVALIFPTEFGDIQREYPILFRKDEAGQTQAFALLGFDKGENLFLEEAGWRARYVPASIERGPFLIGPQEREFEDERGPMIYIDLDDPRVSRAEGLPLFLPQGGAAPYLERISRVLRTIHVGAAMNAPMFAAFADAGLLTPARLEVKIDDATQYNLLGFQTIDEERLMSLSGAELERLHKDGFLHAALFALSSITNVSWLIDLKNRRRAQG